MAIMNPTIMTRIGMTMWKYRSPVLSECRALRKATIAASAKGGAARRRDWMRSGKMVLC
jgi:hypothetical protein